MKITVPEIDEYVDVLEVLEDLPKSVRIKIVAQAIREYKESAEGGAVITLLRKHKKEAVKSKKETKEKLASEVSKDHLKKVMGDFLE